jgi:hypothetical protein
MTSSRLCEPSEAGLEARDRLFGMLDFVDDPLHRCSKNRIVKRWELGQINLGQVDQFRHDFVRTIIHPATSFAESTRIVSQRLFVRVRTNSGQECALSCGIIQSQANAREHGGRKMGDAQVSLSGGGVEAVASLWQRLQADDALHGRVQRVDRPIGDRDLGPGFDFFSVVLGSSGVSVALFRAISVWIENQRSDVTVTITADTKTVEVKRTNLDEVGPTLRDVLGIPDDPEPQEPEGSEGS